MLNEHKLKGHAFSFGFEGIPEPKVMQQNKNNIIGIASGKGFVQALSIILPSLFFLQLLFATANHLTCIWYHDDFLVVTVRSFSPCKTKICAKKAELIESTELFRGWNDDITKEWWQTFRWLRVYCNAISGKLEKQQHDDDDNSFALEWYHPYLTPMGIW